MKKKTLCILSVALLCSFLPWTGRSVSAESVSAPVLQEVPDEGEIQDIQEEVAEEEIPDIQEQITDEGIREEIPDGAEERGEDAVSDNDLSGAGDIPIDEAHFPDSNFRQYLTGSSFDENNDGILSEQEIKKVDTIACNKYYSVQSWEKIESLEGIEYFTEIKTLLCDYNALTSLDVSRNKKLSRLDCDHNALTSLDVSQNQKLKHISCNNNRLESLNVGSIAGLRDTSGPLGSISCAGNQLEELDLTGLQGGVLHILDCSDNRLTSLRINDQTWIFEINCENNRLTHLDFRGGADTVYCNDNELVSLRLDRVHKVYCQRNLLTELDLGDSPWLWYLDCSENMLRTLDMSRYFLKDLSDDPNVELETLICDDNRLESIKFGKGDRLYELSCKNNRLKSLDEKNLQRLGFLDCYGNNISTLDVSKMSILQYLHPDPGTKVIYASTPKLMSLKRDAKKAVLTWDHDAKICDGFFIYRKEETGGWKKIGEIRKRFDKGRYSYTDKYTGKGSVTYTVRAFRSLRPRADADTYEDYQGGYDKRGLIASAVPAAPKDFRAVAGNSQAKLTWKKVSGASGYQIYRKDPKSTKWKKIADVKTRKTTYIDKKAKKGKTYSYCVRAYKKGTGKDKNVITNGVLSATKKAKIR